VPSAATGEIDRPTHRGDIGWIVGHGRRHSRSPETRADGGILVS
jgi:hypothetical protein